MQSVFLFLGFPFMFKFLKCFILNNIQNIYLFKEFFVIVVTVTDYLFLFFCCYYLLQIVEQIDKEARFM